MPILLSKAQMISFGFQFQLHLLLSLSVCHTHTYANTHFWHLLLTNLFIHSRNIRYYLMPTIDTLINLWAWWWARFSACSQTEWKSKEQLINSNAILLKRKEYRALWEYVRRSTGQSEEYEKCHVNQKSNVILRQHTQIFFCIGLSTYLNYVL